MTKLDLKYFRNLKEVSFSPCQTVNIIYGDNAQGKTNLLEAIWLFSGNQSFRSAKIQDFISFSENRAEIRMEFEDSKREQTAKISFSGKKEWILNGVPLKKASDLSGNFYCVVFTPSDLGLADGSPKGRRRFLDLAISQITPQYIGYLDQYEKVLEQRNALLKNLYRFPNLKDTIEVWDQQLSKLGTILSIYRSDYIKKLSVLVTKIYDGLSASQEKLDIFYQSTVFDELDSVTKYEKNHVDRYFLKLREMLSQDIKQGFTSVGIHRDDLELKINDLSVKSFGSRGQIRSSVLALKLGEAEVLRKITGENPVILLDDVMSELDTGRQDYILNHVKDKQVFISCCDIWGTLRLQSGKVFQVENGQITMEKDVNTLH